MNQEFDACPRLSINQAFAGLAGTLTSWCIGPPTHHAQCIIIQHACTMHVAIPTLSMCLVHVCVCVCVHMLTPSLGLMLGASWCKHFITSIFTWYCSVPVLTMWWNTHLLLQCYHGVSSAKHVLEVLCDVTVWEGVYRGIVTMLETLLSITYSVAVKVAPRV